VIEEKELMVREYWQLGPPAQADDDNRGFAGWSQVQFLCCGDSDCHIISDNIGSDEFYRVAPVADLEKMRDDELGKKGIYTIMKEQSEKESVRPRRNV